MDSRVRCPNPACPEPYDVQKVTEIIRAGSVTGYNSFGYGSYTTATSALVSQLEAQRPPTPEAPKAPEGGCTWVMGAGVVAFVGFIVVFSIMGMLGILPTSVRHDPSVGIPFLVGIYVAIFVLLLPVARSFTKTAKGNYQSNLRIYQAAKERYNKAGRRWEASYYSPRCGSVFVPGDTRFVPVERMAELL